MNKSRDSLWESWNRKLDFLNKVPDNELRLHVGFLYLLGTPIESDYWRAQNFASGNYGSALTMFNDYKTLTEAIPKTFWLSEPDPSAQEFSIPKILEANPDVCLYLNKDILRTQVDITNMYKFGILEQVKSVIEIGGGYGQLAAAFSRVLPKVKYTIVDLPTQLNIQNRWLSHIGLDVGYSSENQISLISSEDFDSCELKFDLMINVNSFCEMEESEIEKYIDGQRVVFKWLYSNNREIQFMNVGLSKPLSDIFTKYFRLSPSLNSYMASELHFIKYVFLGGEIGLTKELTPDEIHGVVSFNNQLETN